MNTWTIFWIMILMLPVAILLILWFFERQYKHKVIIRDLANKRKIITIDKAKTWLDDKKIEHWKLRHEKDMIKRLMPVPPNDAIEITKHGKKFVECYRTEQGEYVYITDTIDDVTPLKPLTTNDRMVLINNIEKAEARKLKDWKKDIPVMIMSASFVLLVICGFIFMPDVIETYTKGSQQITESLNAYEQIRHDYRMQEIREMQNVTKTIEYIANVQIDNEKRLEQLEQR